MPHHTTLEFHDSEVSSVGMQGLHAVVRFAAGHIRRPGAVPGSGEGSAGFLQSLELVCHAPTEVKQEPGCFGRLADGVLRVAGQRLTAVPVPFVHEGVVVVELAFANGATCRIVAQGAALQAPEGVRFVESFKC